MRYFALASNVLLTALILLALPGCATRGGAYFDSGGVSLHYKVRGEGEPVVLVHGYGVDADRNWRWPGIAGALAREYQVVFFDLRGHGKSEKPHDPSAYGLEMAEDVIRLMDHLEIDRAHVVGYSLGGFIALKLVTTHPDRLITAVPCAAGWEEAKGDNILRLMSVAGAVDGPEGFRPLFRELGMRGRGPVGRVKMGVSDRYFRAHNDTVALAALLETLPDLEVTEAELRANRVPVRSIVGTKDTLRLGIDNMEGIMSNHDIVYIKGGDHATTVLRHSFLEAIREFLREHPASGEGVKQHTERQGEP